MEIRTIKKTLSNLKIREHILSLQPILTQRNIVGYIAARNMRILSDALTEYTQFEHEAIIKFGTADKDSNGKPTGTTSIQPNSDSFNKFLEEMKPYQEITQEVSIMFAKFDDVIGILSGEEILSIDWMLED